MFRAKNEEDEKKQKSRMFYNVLGVIVFHTIMNGEALCVCACKRVFAENKNTR